MTVDRKGRLIVMPPLPEVYVDPYPQGKPPRVSEPPAPRPPRPPTEREILAELRDERDNAAPGWAQLAEAQLLFVAAMDEKSHPYNCTQSLILCARALGEAARHGVQATLFPADNAHVLALLPAEPMRRALWLGVAAVIERLSGTGE